MSPAVRERARRWLLGEDPPDDLDPAVELRQAYALGVALTLIILLLHAPPRSSNLLGLLAVGGLAVPRLARNRWYWVLVLGVFAASPIARPWLALDNHHWLQLYWVAAIALSRFFVAGDRALRYSARLLIGLSFTFAVVWKLLAPEFPTGAFFELRIASDHRLADVATAFGLLEDDAYRANRSVINAWRDPAGEPEPGAAAISEPVLRITPWLAWATIVIEATVAVTFLAPLRERVRWLRDASLLVFVAGTYPFAPVLGYGRLLLAMGAVQSQLPPRVRALVYVGGFLGVSLLAERDVVLDWLGELLDGPAPEEAGRAVEVG